MFHLQATSGGRYFRTTTAQHFHHELPGFLQRWMLSWIFENGVKTFLAPQ
jgi:hypothetical protein